LADSAAQVAALPAPTTMMSCSGMSMRNSSDFAARSRWDRRRASFETPAARAPQDDGLF
jgi:hypothetical protein